MSRDPRDRGHERRLIDEAPREMTRTGEEVELVAVKAVARRNGQLDGHERDCNSGDGARRERRQLARRDVPHACFLNRRCRHTEASGTSAAHTKAITVSRAASSSYSPASRPSWRCHANHVIASNMTRAAAAASGIARRYPADARRSKY